MAWDRAIDLFVNVGSLPDFPLLAGRSSAQPAERPLLVSGDKHLVRVWFLDAAGGNFPAVRTLAVGDAIVLAGKTKPTAANLLFSATGFAQVGAGDDAHYEAELDLTTAELLTAFDGESSLLCTIELEVQNSTNTLRRTRQFTARINRGVYSDEAVPAPAQPAYPAPDALLTGGLDTPRLKRGTKQLAAGDYEAVPVAFPSNFAVAPSSVVPWVMKKATGALIFAVLNHDTITAAGFTVDLTTAVPGDAALGDYRLGYIAIL